MEYQRLELRLKLEVTRRVKRLAEEVGIRLTFGELEAIRALAVKWHLSDWEIRERVRRERHDRQRGYRSTAHRNSLEGLTAGLLEGDFLDNRR